ncbi:hypothetical protein NQ036_03455 [Brevibacterium sp. 91QC2O2]|uniref:DUF6907 domain-containing protein n=1 Tax=Brevibacterium sp. 91QC2O2 TaxID=2968458 RepID=UPI00211CAD49|nr:hypothetical protein [Brevibacterium sp. 91QC2O2]MCQ9367303.1 hypothetical protein [Brevibacterium sp. 91QC2O2]
MTTTHTPAWATDTYTCQTEPGLSEWYGLDTAATVPNHAGGSSSATNLSITLFTSQFISNPEAPAPFITLEMKDSESPAVFYLDQAAFNGLRATLDAYAKQLEQSGVFAH